MRKHYNQESFSIGSQLLIKILIVGLLKLLQGPQFGNRRYKESDIMRQLYPFYLVLQTLTLILNDYSFKRRFVFLLLHKVQPFSINSGKFFIQFTHNTFSCLKVALKSIFFNSFLTVLPAHIFHAHFIATLKLFHKFFYVLKLRVSTYVYKAQLIKNLSLFDDFPRLSIAFSTY